MALTSKPSWLSYYPNSNKTTEGVNFGFDDTGMWFLGDAGSGGEDDSIAYPIRTNYDIPEDKITTVTFTFVQGDCSDQGVCFFVSGTDPQWGWEPNITRVSFVTNCGDPAIEGQTGEADNNDELVPGVYTATFTYDPTQPLFTLSIYGGSIVSGDPLITLTLAEALPSGAYRIGFDADNDDEEVKSYFLDAFLGAMDTRLKPVITFRVKTYDPAQLVSQLLPDGNKNNIILQMENKTVYIPGWPAPLKHDDTFTLYGMQAIILKNEVDKLNAGGTMLVIDSIEG